MGWENISDGVRHWFNLEGVLDYLLGRTLSAEENRKLGEKLWQMPTDAYLEYMARELFPLRDQLIDGF